MTWIALVTNKNTLWFRWFGLGFLFSWNAQPLFSERNGISPSVRIGKLRIKVLKDEGAK